MGYKKIDDHVVIDEEMGPIVKDVLTKFSEGGWTYTQIASYAFERGIKSRSGKQKTTDAIKKILANYFYAGYTTSKLSDKMNKGLHEALVSLEVIKKNRGIIDGTINNYFLHGDNNNNNNNNKYVPS